MFLPIKFFIYFYLTFIISFIGLLTFKIQYNGIFLIYFYYYIWFSDALIVFYQNKDGLNKNIIIMIFISYLKLIISYYLLLINGKKRVTLGVYPILEIRHFTTALFALSFTLFYYSYLYTSIKIKNIYEKVIHIFISLSLISFSLYLLHYSIQNFFMQYLQINGLILIGVTFMLTVILSYLSEIKLYNYIRCGI